MANKPHTRRTSRKRRGRGEGAVYRRSDGVWCGSVSAGYDSNGKRRRIVVYGKSKAEAQEKLRTAQVAGVPSESCRLTVKEFMLRWLETSVKPSLAPATHARYEQVVKTHINEHIGHRRLTKLEPIHVQHLFAAQEKAGASDRQRQLAGVILQKALNEAVRLQMVRHNPCLGIQKPRPEKKEMQFWNERQVGRFLKEAANDRLSTMYVLAIATGMREGELFGLEWSDVDFEAGAVSVNRTIEDITGTIRVKPPKTAKSRRRIDLPQAAVTALHEHRKAMLAEGHVSGPVFCDRDGGYLRRQNVLRRSFRPAIEAVNKKESEAASEAGRKPDLLPVIRFHDLRHTSATLLLLQGVNPKVVSERLGHADVTITLNIYSHVLPTMQREAADKLNRVFA